MKDERLFQRLAAHGGAVEVDPGFEDRLYALLQSEMRRPERSSRPVLLLVAALFAILVVSAAIAIGSGLIDLPWVVDGSPTPNPSPAASESLAPSPSLPVSSEPTWTATGSTIEASRETFTRLLDGAVLATGGSCPIPDCPLASAELYEPSSGAWIVTGSMVRTHGGHTATLLVDGRVLVAGGGSGGGPLSTAELYDARSGGSWSATGNMVEGHGGHVAALLLDGRVLVAGGGILAQSAELYDPSSGTWTATGNMIEARVDPTITVLRDGTVLVTGGQFFGSGTAELYDPSTGTWTATGSLAEGRIGHTAALLPDGRVLVAGGYTNDSSGNFAATLASAELFDPANGTWTATGSMAEARADHAAVYLPGGVVLVAGGSDSSTGTQFASAELYDPANGTWTATVSMIAARANHAATQLLNGDVLVAGGGEGSVELYDPGSGP